MESFRKICAIIICLGPYKLLKVATCSHQRHENITRAYIKEEFDEKQCHWVVSKTNNRFSTIPVDEAHEQENAYVKGSGGGIGLTENPVAFRRWMLAGPELVRLKQQFEDA